MDSDRTASVEAERLEADVQRAHEAYEHAKRRLADEWSRIQMVAKSEHGFVAGDSLSRLESVVANRLPALRADRDEAKATYDAATARLESFHASIAAKAKADEAKRVELPRLRTQKHQVLQDVTASTQSTRIDRPLMEAATQRRIKGLIHFTRIETLGQLPKYGLLSRIACDSLGIPCTENDGERLDHLLDHISLSVSWPNWQLFFRFRKNSMTSEDEWCVLVLHPDVIWTLDCLFTAENAASSRESSLSVEDRKGVTGFSRLFDDSGGAGLGLVRSQLGLPEHMPTCHQAEVLVRRCVPWNRVLRIVVSSSGSMRRAQAVLPQPAHALLKVNREPFGRRCDWKQWIDARDLPPST